MLFWRNWKEYDKSYPKNWYIPFTGWLNWFASSDKWKLPKSHHNNWIWILVIYCFSKQKRVNVEITVSIKKRAKFLTGFKSVTLIRTLIVLCSNWWKPCVAYILPSARLGDVQILVSRERKEYWQSNEHVKSNISVMLSEYWHTSPLETPVPVEICPHTFRAWV